MRNLPHHLFSLSTLVKHGHAFGGRSSRVADRLKSELYIYPVSVVWNLVQPSLRLPGRLQQKGKGSSCIRPEVTLLNKSAINIDDFRCSAGHSYEVLLRETAQRQRLRGKSCWSAEGAPWPRVSAKVSSSLRTHEQIINSRGFLWNRYLREPTSPNISLVFGTRPQTFKSLQ